MDSSSESDKRVRQVTVGGSQSGALPPSSGLVPPSEHTDQHGGPGGHRQVPSEAAGLKGDVRQVQRGQRSDRGGQEAAQEHLGAGQQQAEATIIPHH